MPDGPTPGPESPKPQEPPKKTTAAAKRTTRSRTRIQATMAAKPVEVKPDSDEFSQRFGTLMTEGGQAALGETVKKITENIDSEPDATFTDLKISRERMKELVTGMLGAGAGAGGLVMANEYLGQTIASIIAVADEPLAALAIASILTAKHVKETRRQGEKVIPTVTKKFKDKWTQLGLIVSGALPVENPLSKAKTALATMGALALAYWATKDPTVSEPINAFLGAGVGSFVATHGREFVIGHENFEEALTAYVSREYPNAAHELQKLASIEGTKSTPRRPHGRAGWQGDHSVHKAQTPLRKTPGRLRN